MQTAREDEKDTQTNRDEKQADKQRRKIRLRKQTRASESIIPVKR